MRSSPTNARLWTGPGSRRRSDLMRPARERAAGVGCVANLVSGIYVPRVGRVGGLRYSSGTAHLLGCDLQR